MEPQEQWEHKQLSQIRFETEFKKTGFGTSLASKKRKDKLKLAIKNAQELVRDLDGGYFIFE